MSCDTPAPDIPTSRAVRQALAAAPPPQRVTVKELLTEAALHIQTLSAHHPSRRVIVNLANALHEVATRLERVTAPPPDVGFRREEPTSLTEQS